MSVPRETKVWVGLWLAVAGFNLLIAIVHASLGEWGDAWDGFARGVIAAYVGQLIYQRDGARQFRTNLIDAVRGGRWRA